MAVVLNPGFLDQLARSDAVTDACRKTGEAIAEKVRSAGLVVGDTVADGLTEKVNLSVEVLAERSGIGAIVIINHPAGAAEQAKHGVLTRAAAATGLPVT